MKRKALDKLESIAKRDIRPGVGTSASLMTDVPKPPPKTIKDLPQDLLNLISKYGDNYTIDFNPRKDIGPLEPNHIFPSITPEDIREHGDIIHSLLKSKNDILRASEQGPMNLIQHTLDARREYLLKKTQLAREYNLTRAIFGDDHPSLDILSQKSKTLEDLYNGKSIG
jgi:hypothetical protein